MAPNKPFLVGELGSLFSGGEGDFLSLATDFFRDFDFCEILSASLLEEIFSYSFCTSFFTSFLPSLWSSAFS